MRIAFLCKRHYTGKDVIHDRYGRLYELPRQLNRLGHDVQAWCLDYRGCRDEAQQHDLTTNQAMRWNSRATRGMRIAHLPTYPLHLLKQLDTFRPDLLIGASDIPHVALSVWLSRQLGLPCVIDLYDNFESFGQARIPGFHILLRYAIRNADLIVTVSRALREKIQRDHRPRAPIQVMPNGINASTFAPGSRSGARKLLGLPLTAPLIGTAGCLSRMKGVDTLYAAWQRLQQARPELHLVLAGPREKNLPLPIGSRVHYLGELAETQVATLFRALDVGVITVQDSPFGRYCFPQKASEMLACQLPIVASNVGEMPHLLASLPQALFNPDNPHALAMAVLSQLDAPCLSPSPALNWNDLVKALEPALEQLDRSYSRER